MFEKHRLWIVLISKQASMFLISSSKLASLPASLLIVGATIRAAPQVKQMGALLDSSLAYPSSSSTANCVGFFFLIYLLFMSVLVFVSVRGLSPVAASGGHSSSRCAGLSLSRALLLRSTGSRRAGSAIAAHGPSCSVACGIFPDQGSNPCPLH